MKKIKRHSFLLAASGIFLVLPIIITGVYSFVSGWSDVEWLLDPSPPKKPQITPSVQQEFLW
jgi:ABC-type spermidine/putrescine transport system permease subunit II